VSRAGRQALALRTCAAGDTACALELTRAKGWLDIGDQYALRGNMTFAVTAWSAALPYVLKP